MEAIDEVDIHLSHILETHHALHFSRYSFLRVFFCGFDLLSYSDYDEEKLALSLLNVRVALALRFPAQLSRTSGCHLPSSQNSCPRHCVYVLCQANVKYSYCDTPTMSCHSILHGPCDIVNFARLVCRCGFYISRLVSPNITKLLIPTRKNNITLEKLQYETITT